MPEFTSRSQDLSQEAWDAFVVGHPSGHLLQSWEWGEFKAQFGWRPVRVALERSGQLVAAAQLLLRSLPVGTLAYLPKGPVVDRDDAVTSAALLRAVHIALRRHWPILLKVEPEWADGPEARAWLAALRFRPSAQTIQPRHTIVVDLRPDEESLLQAMKPKTRYNIRLASRKGVTIREGGAGDLGAFHQLMTVTGERDGFGVHSQAYFGEAWQRFAPLALGYSAPKAPQARLLLAEFEGQILAGLMVFCFGRSAWYMYGASSNEHREVMPNYLLQWQAMRWAKAVGCESYDLWGIPDLDIEVMEQAVEAQTTPTDPPPALWGVYRLKRGFGGEPLRYVGAYDYVYRPLLYRVLTWFWQRRREMAG